MPHDYIPVKDTVLQDWLGNFISIAKYEHTGNPAGVKIMYHIKAQGGEIQSPPSNVAVVNEG